ncbi:MAG TPA: hypothetical protein VIO14_13930, partial [Dehalococcoidia bacterium]
MVEAVVAGRAEPALQPIWSLRANDVAAHELFLRLRDGQGAPLLLGRLLPGVRDVGALLAVDLAALRAAGALLAAAADDPAPTVEAGVVARLRGLLGLRRHALAGPAAPGGWGGPRMQTDGHGDVTDRGERRSGGAGGANGVAGSVACDPVAVAPGHAGRPNGARGCGRNGRVGTGSAGAARATEILRCDTSASCALGDRAHHRLGHANSHRRGDAWYGLGRPGRLGAVHVNVSISSLEDDAAFAALWAAATELAETVRLGGGEAGGAGPGAPGFGGRLVLELT